MRMVAPAVGLAAAMAVGAVVAAVDGLGTADGATATVGATVAVGAQAATITAIMDNNSQAAAPGQGASFAFFKPFWTRIQSLTFLNSSSPMDQLLTTIHTGGGRQIFPKIAPKGHRE